MTDPSPSISERVLVAMGALINRSRIGRHVQNLFLRGVGYTWMRAGLSRWMLVEGVEQFRDLDPDRGVLIVCNHRSFFDFFALSVAFFAAPTPWIERVCFPVRGDFFYQRPLGFLTNLLVCAGAMYPPFFRERAKARLNKDSLEYLTSVLRQRGWLVGFHPEGTRSKLPDPYTLLPMQPGAGEIAMKTGAIVVPVFINGLSNRIVHDVRHGLTAGATRKPCICVFGSPLDLSDIREDRISMHSRRKASDLFGEAILALAVREKELRAQCETDGIPASDPRWLKNMPGSRLYAFRGTKP